MSSCPLQLGVPSGTGISATENTEHMFLATMARSTVGIGLGVCVVGLVKSSRQFRTSMRFSRHNSERIDYLGGLAHLHFVMREHACRYGFILTETELVIVRNGIERIPLFGLLEVARCQFPTDASNSIDFTGDEAEEGVGSSTVPIAPCLALWGLCMLASYSPHDSHVPAHTKTGAGTRTKTVERDAWMPRLHAEEKRIAKLNRGWVFPADPFTSMEKSRIP